LTTEPASIVPLTVIAVALLGEVGLMFGAVGADGAIVSFVKPAALEQDEVLPAASVAVTEYDVPVFAGAVTEKPTA
jgi:hypothetical protein